MTTIRVGGQQHEYLAITIVNRIHPGCSDYWDGNWLNAVIKLAAGGFQGNIDGYLRAEEFVSFRDELSRFVVSSASKACFETMEGWLSIELSGDRLGHVDLQCQVRDQPGIGNLLQFRLKLDQTDVAPMLTSITGALEKFPVVGRPDP